MQIRRKREICATHLMELGTVSVMAFDSASIASPGAQLCIHLSMTSDSSSFRVSQMIPDIASIITLPHPCTDLSSSFLPQSCKRKHTHQLPRKPHTGITKKYTCIGVKYMYVPTLIIQPACRIDTVSCGALATQGYARHRLQPQVSFDSQLVLSYSQQRQR